MPTRLPRHLEGALQDFARAWVAGGAKRARPTKRDLAEWAELLRAPSVTLERIEQARWRPARRWSEELAAALSPLLGRVDIRRGVRLGLLSGGVRLDFAADGRRDYTTLRPLLVAWCGNWRNIDLYGLYDVCHELELSDPYVEMAVQLSICPNADGTLSRPTLAEVKRATAERDRRYRRAEMTPLERAEASYKAFSREPKAVLPIAKLHVSSGAIVACDPQGQLDEAPFARRVAKGEHPVELLVRGGKKGTVEAARVRLAPGHPSRWELALHRAQAAEDAGYPVDSALGCFTDAATLRLLQAKLAKLSPDEEEDERAAFLRARDRNRGLWLEQRPDPRRPNNLVAFSTGRGDGNYLSFWGLDSAGRPVVLLTDFSG